MMQACEAGGGEAEVKVCRVCLEGNATVPVFGRRGGVQYCTKMMKCAAVSVCPGDGLPADICLRCAAQLDAGYELAARCEASDRALRALCAPLKLEPKPEQCDDSCDRDYDSGEPPPPDEQSTPCHDDAQTEVKSEHSQLRLQGTRGAARCPVCSKLFRSRSALVIHSRSHTKEKPFKCDICKKSYTSKSVLKIHVMRHYGRKPESTAPRETDRRRQRVRSGPFQCSACGRVLASRAALDAHARTHSGERPFACAACPARFRLRGTLARHEASAHPARNPAARMDCDHCGKSFRARTNLVTHLRVHSGERPYACARCPARFTQRSALARHSHRHTGERPHACALCGRAFRDRTAMRRHLAVHSAERAHACPACPKTFKTRQSLREHVARAHGAGAACVCAACGARLASRAGLAAHAARAHSARSGLCVACARPVPDLAAHEAAHAGARPHACPLCARGFASRRALAHHEAVQHRNKHKLRCPAAECEARFPTAPMLEYHVLKAHTGARPFPCERCERAYRRRCDLTRHQRTHHAAPPAPLAPALSPPTACF